MLKFIFSCLKLLGYTVLVLMAGNYFHWRGRSLADHAKISMNLKQGYHLEELQEWATEMISDARKGAHKKTRSQKWERVTSLNEILENQ